MNRKLIPCTVKDEYLIGAGVAVGAEGSGNDSALQLEFGNMWGGLVKYVTFRNALGEDPVTVLLTTDMIRIVERPVIPEKRPEEPPCPPFPPGPPCPPSPFPPGPPDPCGPWGPHWEHEPPPPIPVPPICPGPDVPPCRPPCPYVPPDKPRKPKIEEIPAYIVPIPSNAKALEGDMIVTVQGYSLNKDGSQVETATMTATAYFKVLPSGWSIPEDNTVTPTLAQQLQWEIEDIQSDIVKAAKVADSLGDAEKARDCAWKAAEDARKSAEEAGEFQQAVEDITVSAVSLPYDHEATAEKTRYTSGYHIKFGIPRGQQGADGPQGEQGIQGIPGRDGKDGRDGMNAVNVPQGSLFGFSVDENGHLILTYGGTEPPPFHIGADGHLYYDLDND